jgi:hypothetical protein
LLSLAMIGMAGVILKMLYGPAPAQGQIRESRLSLVTPIVFAALVLVLGLVIPNFLSQTLTAAAGLVGGVVR